VNNIKNELFTVNLDLGYSDHIAQLLYIKSKNLLNSLITTYKRFFTDENVEEFQYLLQKEKWDEVSVSNEPNTSFNIFIDTLCYYFNIVFPIRATYVKESIVNKWITKGIIVSRNKLRLLNNIKKSTNLPMKSLKYIQSYQLMYWKVIKEAKM
jgi:uncharacterized 2Fe-2S/4Fe-4S cluster protein (DUF4445 family)